MNHLLHQLLPYPGNLKLDNLHLSLGIGEIQIEMEAAALQGIGHLPAVIAGQNNKRNVLGGQRTDFRNTDLEIAQHLQEKGFELRVRFIHLVDQENDRIGSEDGTEQRAGQQEAVREKYVVPLGDRVDGLLKRLRPMKDFADLIFQDLGIKELFGVFPLIKGLRLI